MARGGPPARACKVQAREKIHGWAQAERGDGAGHMAGSGSGRRSGCRAAAAPAAARKQPARRQQQVKRPQQQQPGGTADALIAGPVASSVPLVAASVASVHASVAAPVAPSHASVAAPVAPVAAPVDAQHMSLTRSLTTMLSEHSAQIQDLQRQIQLRDRQQLQLRQQLQDQDDVFSQVQH